MQTGFGKHENEFSDSLFRVDRKTFRFFLGRQQPQEVEDVKQELRTIDGVIDRVSVAMLCA